MRPHIRSSSEHRRRSIAASSDLPKHELSRRISLTSPPFTSSSSNNTDSVTPRQHPTLYRNNSFSPAADRLSEVSETSSSNSGTSLLGYRSDSLTGCGGNNRRHSLSYSDGIHRRESTPSSGSFNKRSSVSHTLESSSLDPNSYDVARRYMILCVVTVVFVVLSSVAAWYKLSSISEIGNSE